jgi:hypothetical protein
MHRNRWGRWWVADKTDAVLTDKGAEIGGALREREDPADEAGGLETDVPELADMSGQGERTESSWTMDRTTR